jgi:acylglycerol lipase
VGAKDKELRFYEGPFYDLLNSIGKEKVMADIKVWIEKRF